MNRLQCHQKKSNLYSTMILHCFHMYLNKNAKKRGVQHSIIMVVVIIVADHESAAAAAVPAPSVVRTVPTEFTAAPVPPPPTECRVPRRRKSFDPTVPRAVG